MKLNATYFSRLVSTLATIILLSGCVSNQHSIHSAALIGEFKDKAEFTSDLIFVVDSNKKTFTGILQNFQSTRSGLETPIGGVLIDGTVSRTPEGETLLQGKGNGTLTQGNRKYLVEFEMGSSYINEGFDLVRGWYFVGGEIRQKGEFLGWLPGSGKFEAKLICKSNLFNQRSCKIPQQLQRTLISP